MTSKRPPLSFPELEPKGRAAILRTAEEIKAEDELLERQHAGIPEPQQAGGPASQPASMRETRGDGMLASQLAGKRVLYSKATYRLSMEAIEAIEDTKRILRRRHGIKVSLEEIAEEAILAAYRDLLENQGASFLALKLAGRPAGQRSRNAR